MAWTGGGGYISDGASLLFDAFKRMLGEFRSGTGASRGERARSELYAEARRLFVAVIRGKVPQEVAEDLAQDKILRLLDYLIEDDVPAASAPLYLRRTANNAAYDYFRAQKRRRDVGVEPSVLNSIPAPDPSWEDDEQEREEDETRSVKRDLIMRVMKDPAMPDRYRQALRNHYLDGVSIEALTDREVERKPLDKHGSPRSRKTARNTVDKLMQRARDWVRVRAEEVDRRGEGEDK